MLCVIVLLVFSNIKNIIDSFIFLTQDKKCVGNEEKMDIICLSRPWSVKNESQGCKKYLHSVTIITLLWLIGSLKYVLCTIQPTNNAYWFTSLLNISVMASQWCYILADMVPSNISMGKPENVGTSYGLWQHHWAIVSNFVHILVKRPFCKSMLTLV